jgi:NurA-like 5'-3' nuclease
LGRIVGISKTSHRSELGEEVPDLAVFEEVTRSPGYSEPYDRLVTKRFPAYQEFFESLVIRTCYARFEEGKGVYVVEFPWEAGEEEMVGILERIKGCCVMGYPYPLRRAHRQVLITQRDVERFASSLGIYERTGREVVE